MFYKAVGDRIARKRKEAGLSQESLAELTKSSRVLIAKIEEGERRIKADLLVQVAEALNTNTDYLLRGVDTENLDCAADLGLENDTIAMLKSYPGGKFGRMVGTHQAINYFLSRPEGYTLLYLLYVYMCYDKDGVFYGSKLKKDRFPIPDDLSIYLEECFYSDVKTDIVFAIDPEDIENMLAQKLIDRIKKLRHEMRKGKKASTNAEKE